ncbi:MAG: hypothetical protein H6Q72_4557 [Firmicutes bacterium]|nr:hypothetical protein [Bacillota bacterium]
MEKRSFRVKLISSVLCFMLLFVSSSLAFAEEQQEAQENINTKITRILAENENSTKVVQFEGVLPGHVYIPRGTTFEVELVEAASSKTNVKGQEIAIRMVDSLIINNVTIIPKDMIGEAIVSDAQKAGGFGRKGSLTISPQTIKTINGVKVPLQSELKGAGHSDGGAVAVAVAVSLVGGIFMKGTNINYPAGTKIKVAVEKDTDLNATPETLASEMDLSKPQGNKLILAVK